LGGKGEGKVDVVDDGVGKDLEGDRKDGKKNGGKRKSGRLHKGKATSREDGEQTHLVRLLGGLERVAILVVLRLTDDGSSLRSSV
jgi:hypothetical protein